MPYYKYSAKNISGKKIEGMIVANDEIDLANKLSTQGYYLIKYSLTEEKSLTTGKTQSKIKLSYLLQLTIHLSTLINAGLSLLESLKTLVEDSENESVKKILSNITIQIEQGISLAKALAMYPGVFSPLYISIIEAGEMTGKLSESLLRMSNILQWQLELKKKIYEAATYPIILFSVMLLVVFILLTFVIPKFQPIFQQLGGSLPLPTQLLITTSEFIRNYWWGAIIFIVLLVIVYKVYNSTEKGRYNIDRLKLKLPLIGDIINKISLTRFTQTFSVCFLAGIELLKTMDIAKKTCGNQFIAFKIEDAKQAVKVGSSLSDALKSTGQFPPMVLRMVNVGERSGSLSGSLEKIAEFYNQEINNKIKYIFALAEPIMIIVMGIVVGLIALAIFLPIFRLSQLVGG